MTVSKLPTVRESYQISAAERLPQEKRNFTQKRLFELYQSCVGCKGLAHRDINRLNHT